MTRQRPVSGRFDLIPPGAERRLAEFYARDAHEFGVREWESANISQSAFLNMARDALNRLHARDTSEDFASKAVFALFGFIDVEAKVRAGRLPPDLADMPALDPILVEARIVPQLPAAEAPPVPPLPPQLLSGK